MESQGPWHMGSKQPPPELASIVVQNCTMFLQSGCNSCKFCLCSGAIAVCTDVLHIIFNGPATIALC